MIAKFRGRSLKIQRPIFIRPQQPRKAHLRIKKKCHGIIPFFSQMLKMVNPKNSIGFFVPFFWVSLNFQVIVVMSALSISSQFLLFSLFLGPIPVDLYKLTGYKNPYNWILYSQKMTGSHPHSDPDLTGAWNYLISGRKYWVILPTGKIRLFYVFFLEQLQMVARRAENFTTKLTHILLQGLLLLTFHKRKEKKGHIPNMASHILYYYCMLLLPSIHFIF